MQALDPAGENLLAALRLQLEWGIDEALAEAPLDRFLRAPPPPPPRPARSGAGRSTRVDADTLGALHALMDRLDHPLRRTAAHTVGPVGDPGTGLLLMADAPEADDDRSGQAFSGAAGAVLDRVLGSAGLDRGRMVLGFLVPWRPPGGRPPTAAEIAFCLPYAQRMVALVRPHRLLLAGNLAWSALTGDLGGRRAAKGRWSEVALPEGPSVSALPMRPPSLWLHDAAAKRETWSEVLALRAALDS